MNLEVEPNDNDLAAVLDPEAAASMQAARHDIRFIGEALAPAFHDRESGLWSAQTWHGGQPCTTLKAESFEEVAERYLRHQAGDISLCTEARQEARSQGETAVAEGKEFAAWVREQAEGRAWDELNEMSLAGDKEATAEVIERAVNESGKETPLYDRLLDKHWAQAYRERA